MTLSSRVAVEPGAVPAVRAAMRDAQTATADYYGQTARDCSIEDLGTSVRRFLVATQTVNDLLANNSIDPPTYQMIMSSSDHPGAGVIRGAKYVRNVAQHLAHVIRPRDDHALIGGALGYRIYTFWDYVPAQSTHSCIKGRNDSRRITRLNCWALM